jgi:O-antigen/teichoic acid export membrane protein
MKVTRDVVRKVVRFASGEALARLLSVAVMIFLGHKYGVTVIGVYALAVGVSYYTVPLIDFGLRHIGARLLAQYPEHGPEIVRRIQRRRLLMAGLLIPILAVYSLFARLPLELRAFVFVFAITSALYAASLDWAAWGKEHLQWIGGVRALIPLSILLAVVISGAPGDQVLWWAAAGNLAGYILQAVVFRTWWAKQARVTSGPASQLPVVITNSLVWRRTAVMGVAWCAQIAFNSIDTLMLGVLSSPEQVGLYASAYRILTQVLITYYLIVLSVFPMLSRVDPAKRTAVLRARFLLLIFGIGSVIAVVVSVFRRELLEIIFGRSFLPAAPLVLILAWAIPLDFLTSYLNNAYIAWGMERKMLPCILVGAGTNIILNAVFLRRYGATAAAINTIISYLVYFVGLIFVRRALKREMSGEAIPDVVT